MSDSDRILERLLSLHPRLIDLSLGRIHRLLAELDHPEHRLPPVVHIAGTNGKGSVVAMIRRGLAATGRRVHVYTSPHLVRFHERVVIAGRRITEARLVKLLTRCEHANSGKPITFFEITTAAALLGFAETPADWCLLETGLGGRVDATNVVAQPKLTVISRVGIDHREFLGDTLASIAREKAGIIKAGVPCVVAKQPPQALKAIETVARRVKAPLLRFGNEWRIDIAGQGMVFEDAQGKIELPMPALAGTHQVENAGAAVAALRALKAGAPKAAVRTRAWPARMQRLRQGPLTSLAPNTEMWLDGGHNADAAQALATDMRTRMPARPLAMVVAMKESKEVGEFWAPFGGVAERAWTVPLKENGVAPRKLAQVAKGAGVPCKPVKSVEDAVREIAQKMPNARVLVCGSLYLAGDVLSQYGG